MNLNEIKQNLTSVQTMVDLVLEQENYDEAHEILQLIEKEVLTEENLRVPNDDVKKYQNLASRLRANLFRRLPTRKVPKVFLNDIAYVLDWDNKEFLKQVGNYLDRFKIDTDFSRQQKTLVNNLLANKQRLTQEPILTEDDKKVAPTVGNWIKYFYKKVGGDQQASRIKVAEFFSKDKNVSKLTEVELQKIKNLISLQEYLRRPTEDLMNELVEFTVDLGNGITGYYEDGDVIVLTDLDKKFGESQRSVVKDTSTKTMQSDNLVDTLVTQTEARRPKRTELKPVSSSEISNKVMENPLAITDKKSEVTTINNVDSRPVRLSQKFDDKKDRQEQQLNVHQSKFNKDDFKFSERVTTAAQRMNTLPVSSKEIERKPQLRQDNIKDNQQQKKAVENFILNRQKNLNTKEMLPSEHVTRSQLSTDPVRKEDDNINDDIQIKVHKVYNDSETVQGAIKEQFEQIQAQTGGNVSQVVDRLLNIYEKPDTYKAIALLRVISVHNLWQRIISNDFIQKQITVFANRNHITHRGSLEVQVQLVIRSLLEGIVGFTPQESARVAAQLVSLMHEKGHDDYMQIVYFDMQSEKFMWNEL